MVGGPLEDLQVLTQVEEVEAQHIQYLILVALAVQE
jgi:hypothetical protein